MTEALFVYESPNLNVKELVDELDIVPRPPREARCEQ